MAVRPLTLRTVGQTYTYTSWLRHALTWASRYRVLGDENELKLGAGYITRGRMVADRVKALRRDVLAVPALGPPDGDVSHDDVIINSICQFDFLWCLVAAVVDEHDHRAGFPFYPSFGALYMHRTLPIVHRIMVDPEMREHIVPNATDQEMLAAIGKIDKAAGSENFFDWGLSEGQLPDLVPRLVRPAAP